MLARTRATASTLQRVICVPAAVAARSVEAPLRCAVEHGERRLAYGELLHRADLLARQLRAEPGTVVGLRCRRSIEYVVGAVGILRAGRAYLPIDPALPILRQEFLATDAGTCRILDAGTVAALAVSGADGPDLADPDPHDLAYVVYTSGSTGQPKGVAVEHAALANLVSWHHRAFELSPADRVCLGAGVGFDASAWELWSTLTAGATLVVPDEEERVDPVRLRDFLIARAVTVAFVPTALAHEMLRLSWPGDAALRLMLTGGAALTRRPPEGLPFTVVNNYGPTEATVVATSGVVAPGTGTPTIGRPIDGVTVHVRDAAGVPVPAGEVGELYLGGVGLARGYLGHPELTAERFVIDDAAGRLYRTGDLVRLRPDGELDYCGRTDDQVQVRGYRAEPGEVEAVLAAHPAVIAAAVVAGTDATGATCLRAFYTAAAPVDGLRGWLRRTLPAYLVPATLAHLSRLPLTVNGKVDRATLAALAPADRVVGTAPRNAVESKLAGIWAQVLGFDVGVDEPFDTLGGHSLHAVRLVNRIAEAFGVTVPLAVFFGPVTVAELARRPELAAAGAATRPVPLPRAGDDPARPTAAQSRYWFIDQFVADPSLYNVGTVFAIDGRLDVPALRATLTELLRRHEALRLCIVDTPEGPRQRVEAPGDFPLDVVDLRDRPDVATAVFAAATRRPFDRSRAPLVRAVLARTGDEAWRLCLVAHHMAIDAASLDVLMRDIGRLYPAIHDGGPPPPPPATPSWADIAAWEAAELSGPRLAALREFWTGALRGVPELLDLPTDRPRPAEPSYRGATTVRPVPAGLLARVDTLARRAGASRFMVLLAALAVVLHRYSGQSDVVVGTPVAGRGRPVFEDMVGCFVNTLALRCDLTGGPSFAELLARVRAASLDGYAHQALPFDAVLDALNVTRPRAHHPLFTVMLVVQQPDVSHVALPGGRLRYAGEVHADTARFDLTVVLEPRDGEPTLAVEYATDLFDPATADRLVEHLLRVLATAVDDPGAPVDTLLPASTDERALLLAWGTGPTPPSTVELPAYRLVERRSAAHPDALAIVCGDRETRYGELNSAANRLAHHLRALGVGRDAPVGVCLPRGADAVVSMLAVAKAGGVYLPLDIGYPDERLRRVLDDARPSIVVTRDPARVRRLSPEGAATVDPTQPQHPDDDLDVSVHPDDVAYLIYTSGSTGTPKGVLATHRGLANLTAAKIDLFDVRPDSRVLQFVSLGFGVSIADVHMTLCAGATLVMRGDGALSGADLVALVERYRVTNLVLPASVLAALPAGALPSVRCVAVGGEPCAASLVDRWAPGRRFVNAYGPTEATVATATAVCHAGGGTPPIGRPIPGSRLYVLDDRGRLVPPGVPGELYVAGVGVTRGYHRAPDLTAQRFRPDPFGPGRMYRTGDRARWRPDGQLVLLGRLDDQVNLRGVRIELGDVEAALSAHPAVAEAAAAIQDHPVAGQRLVGYLVDTPGTPRPDAVELRRFLTERVPEHFVPAVFVRLPALPRTATGKLDRRALPTVDDAPLVASRPPEGITEEVLADIWRDVLTKAPTEFGADDDFFALGGQSILAASVMAQIRARFEVSLPVRALFDAPTIAGLADRVEQAIIADLAGESR